MTALQALHGNNMLQTIEPAAIFWSISQELRKPKTAIMQTIAYICFCVCINKASDDIYTKKDLNKTLLTFEDLRDAEDALHHLDGFCVHGRELIVQYAEGDRKSEGNNYVSFSYCCLLLLPNP